MIFGKLVHSGGRSAKQRKNGGSAERVPGVEGKYRRCAGDMKCSANDGRRQIEGGRQIVAFIEGEAADVRIVARKAMA